MNTARAAFIAQSVINLELHNSLTLCNYTLPVWASPLKSRNYRGDPSLEAQAYSAVTGDPATQKDLERDRLADLHPVPGAHRPLHGEGAPGRRQGHAEQA